MGDYLSERAQGDQIKMYLLPALIFLGLFASTFGAPQYNNWNNNYQQNYRSFEYPSSNYQRNSGSFDYPSSDYQMNSGSIEYPSSNYQRNSGSFDYPSSNYQMNSYYPNNNLLWNG